MTGHSSVRMRFAEPDAHDRLTLTVEGRVRGHRDVLRAPLPMVIIDAPDGQEIRRRLTSREMRDLGEKLKPLANQMADFLLVNVNNPKRQAGDPVCLPFSFANQIICMLCALPRPKRGRPPKETTLQLRLAMDVLGSKRAAAREISKKTGEPFERVRRKTRKTNKPRKPQR
jgi:hypothetical protein